MKKLPAIVLAIFVSAGSLMACATAPSLFEVTSYRKQEWADKPFEQIKARCQHTSLRREKNTDGYQLEKVPFKACMNHYGYRYDSHMHSDTVSKNVAPAHEGGVNFDIEKMAVEKSDKSALYR